MASTTSPLDEKWDIIIVGTGAAALSSALSAATSTTPVPKILLIDKAPPNWAGGNGYFTAAAYRTVHSGLSDLLPLVSNVPSDLKDKIDIDPYTQADFLGDLERVTGGRSDPVLGRAVVGQSLETVRWLKEAGGLEWWMSFKRQAYEVDGRWRFWGGLCLTLEDGGKTLIGRLLEKVEEMGCEILYETAARRVLVDGQGRVAGLEVQGQNGRVVEIKAKALILCAGGFEANAKLRGEWMGKGWELAHTRGTPYNTGDMLLEAIRLGAKRVGDFSQTGCHSTCWDADSPKDGGDREKTNEFTKSGYPLGLMVNSEGKRFVDEGVDLRNYTYAKFGRAILEQPDGVAWQVWDSDATGWLRSEEYRDEIVRKTWADSLEELASKLKGEGVRDGEQFVRTIEEYNEAVAAHRKDNPGVKLNPAVRDGLSTQSSTMKLELPKSNWALPIVKAPFLAVKVTSGITFTFGGLAINSENAAVVSEDGTEIEGLYCAGEMVGGLFYGNYPGGSGLTAGGVFGRRAGRAAAERAVG